MIAFDSCQEFKLNSNLFGKVLLKTTGDVTMRSIIGDYAKNSDVFSI